MRSQLGSSDGESVHVDPLDLVTESLRRSTAKELALDQARAQPEIDDGADIGW